MAHKAKDEEEKLLGGEKSATQESMAETLPHVRLRVIYLGGNEKKTARLPGQIVTMPDPDDPDNESLKIREQLPTGYTMYDFASVDDRGRRVTHNIMGAGDKHSGRRYEWVTHLGHLMAFYDAKGPDRERLYEVRGPANQIDAFLKYREKKRKHRDPDQGEAVLKLMDLE